MAFSVARFAALTRKEFQQLGRNRRLIVQLIVPPTLALVAFGFALNPEVKHMRVGVVDESRTPLSRELAMHLTAGRAFDVEAHYGSAREAAAALRAAEIDLAIIVPYHYQDTLARGQTAEVQVIIDAVNANAAGIAQSYLRQSAMSYSHGLRWRLAAGMTPPAAVSARSVPLYNPGLVHSWFFITGVMSTIIFINGSLLSSALTVKERETGTIEQLLMSPVQVWEALLSKTAPVLLLMLVVLLVSVSVGAAVFDLPQRGSWLLLLGSTSLAAIGGIGIGITIATFASTQQQAQLLTFLMIPPMVLISGTFTPLETMPEVLQYLSYVDPLRYMVRVLRGIALKGAGLNLLWPELAALGAIAATLYAVSAIRFRRQLR